MNKPEEILVGEVVVCAEQGLMVPPGVFGVVMEVKEDYCVVSWCLPGYAVFDENVSKEDEHILEFCGPVKLTFDTGKTVDEIMDKFSPMVNDLLKKGPVLATMFLTSQVSGEEMTFLLPYSSKQRREYIIAFLQAWRKRGLFYNLALLSEATLAEKSAFHDLIKEGVVKAAQDPDKVDVFFIYVFDHQGNSKHKIWKLVDKGGKREVGEELKAGVPVDSWIMDIFKDNNGN